MRAAGDREPGLGADRVRGRREPHVVAVHRAGFDPLERRLALGELDEPLLGVEDVAEAVPAAPALQGVEVEAEHLGVGGERWIEATALRQRIRVAVEVVRERQEPRAGRRGRRERRRFCEREAAREPQVPLVREEGAGEPGSARGRPARVGERERLAAEPGELVRGGPAAVAHEEVDPRRE